MSYEIPENNTPSKEEKVCERCGGTPIVTSGICALCFEEENPEYYKKEEVIKNKLAQHGKGIVGDLDIRVEGEITKKVSKLFSQKKKKRGNEFSST